MKKYIVLHVVFIMLLCSCQARQESGEPPHDKDTDTVFTVTIKNECETDICGIQVEYYLNRRAQGGQLISRTPEMDAAMDQEDLIHIPFYGAGFSSAASYEGFGLAAVIVLEGGRGILLGELWEWDAKFGGEYAFTLSGGSEMGYRLEPEENGETDKFKATPWDELPEDMPPPV